MLALQSSKQRNWSLPAAVSWNWELVFGVYLVVEVFCQGVHGHRKHTCKVFQDVEHCRNRVTCANEVWQKQLVIVHAFDCVSLCLHPRFHIDSLAILARYQSHLPQTITSLSLSSAAYISHDFGQCLLSDCMF